jgi:hypothetical protein
MIQCHTRALQTGAMVINRQALAKMGGQIDGRKARAQGSASRSALLSHIPIGALRIVNFGENRGSSLRMRAGKQRPGGEGASRSAEGLDQGDQSKALRRCRAQRAKAAAKDLGTFISAWAAFGSGRGTFDDCGFGTLPSAVAMASRGPDSRRNRREDAADPWGLANRSRNAPLSQHGAAPLPHPRLDRPMRHGLRPWHLPRLATGHASAKVPENNVGRTASLWREGGRRRQRGRSRRPIEAVAARRITHGVCPARRRLKTNRDGELILPFPPSDNPGHSLAFSEFE